MRGRPGAGSLALWFPLPLLSFYQRFWSAFQRVIATLNLKGVPDFRVRLGDRCGGGGGDDDDARATTPVAGGRTYPTRRG